MRMFTMFMVLRARTREEWGAEVAKVGSDTCVQARVRERGWGVSALSALRPASGQALGAGKKGGCGCSFDRLRTGIHQSMTELGCCRKMVFVNRPLVAAFDLNRT
jgi:hypothetical protein